MKKVIVLLVLFVGFSAVAQPGNRQKLRESYAQMTPEQHAILQTKKMTLALDLTSAQQEKVQQWNLDNAKYRKENRDARKAKRADADGKKPTTEEIFTAQSNALDHRIAQKEKLKNILSQEQFAKFEKMQFAKKRKAQKRKGDSSRSRRPR